jgi:hypothetical protein
MEVKVITVTGDVSGMNQCLICDSVNPIGLTLLRAATGTCCGYYIKNFGSADVTVTAKLNDFIDGSAAVTLKQYESIFILDYKTNNWAIMSDNHI